ncbi:hypothetical protein ABT299_12765 [Spirillospora sp. NPDC000708]
MAEERFGETERRQSQNSESAAPPQRSTQDASREADQAGRKPPWWKRPIGWTVSLVAAAVTAAAVPIIQNLLTTQIHKASGAAGLTAKPVPIAWTVTMSQGDLNHCHQWTFPKPLSALPYHDVSVADMAGGDLWALRHGGVEKDTVAYTVTVQARGASQVVLRDLRLTVLNKAPAVHGLTVTNGIGCGNGVSPRYYRADLGQPVPQLKLLTPGKSRGVPVDQAYTVSGSDTETFVINVVDTSPKQFLFTYKLQFDWSQGSSTGTADILSPVGKPFQLNATAHSYTDPAYYASDGTWQRAE